MPLRVSSLWQSFHKKKKEVKHEGHMRFIYFIKKVKTKEHINIVQISNMQISHCCLLFLEENV